jgi:hypothetical protein
MFDFECCSLAQEISFVDHYLLYFRQWFITCLLSALLPFQSLFTESLCGVQLLALPPFSSVLTASHPLCCVLVLSSLFILFFFVVCLVSLPRRLCWFIPWVAGGIPCDAWCSPAGLLHVSQAGLEPASGGMGALLLSQCSMVWRSFVQVRGSGC